MRLQLKPHAPQFGSVSRLTHAVGSTAGQAVNPAVLQLPTHAPPPHVTEPPVGVAHAWLHTPQFAGSFEVFAQAAPHRIAGGVQGHSAPTQPQTPPTQVAVAPAGTEQTCPHAPQLLTSLSVCVSQPLTLSLSQSVYPGSQELTTQMFAVQWGTAWGSVQACPQLPQLDGSVAVWISHPFDGTRSQSVKPALHLKMMHDETLQLAAA